jgi:hypothetical protein
MKCPPILLLIFNRPDTTRRVMQVLQQVKPEFLYIAADGPRESKHDEYEKCKATREVALSSVNWECKVITNFQDHNLGCGQHVSKAISWYFENVEQGIILEDDCIPNTDFFSFCGNLLEKYKNEDNVYTIGGNNFQTGPVGDASYYFSTYGHIWGWATWRRAWKNYKFDLNEYDESEMKNRLKFYFRNLQSLDFWLKIFNIMRTNPIDTWDYQWSFCQWYNGGVSIMPNVNLVSNIGYGEDATHTVNFVEGILERPTKEMPVIIHPAKIQINRKADIHSFYQSFEKKKLGYLKQKFMDKVRYELRKRIGK